MPYTPPPLTLAAPPAPTPAPADAERPPPEPREPARAPQVDAAELAERVYRLLRDELLRARERNG